MCASSPPRPIALDGALRGRDIELQMRNDPDGIRIEGRLFVAVPPLALARLTERPASLLRAFPDHIVGAARWPAGAEERLFFAAKLFGRIFKAWGHGKRTTSAEHAAILWRTDKGAKGAAEARARGRGSEVTFTSFFPRKVDLTRFMLNRLGVEIVLRVMAFAVRVRLERLWQQGALPQAVEGRDARASSVGVAPRIPWMLGTPVPPELRRWVTPPLPGAVRP